MKKLLTILLSVLCLFSVVGVNVSAEIETTFIDFIAAHDGDCPEANNVKFIGSDGKTTRGKLVYDKDYVFIDLNNGGKIKPVNVPFKENENVTVLLDSSLDPKLHEYYQNLFNKPVISPFKKDGDYYIGSKEPDATVYIAYTFTIQKKASEMIKGITLSNVNTGAATELTKFEDVKVESKFPIFVGGESHYITESNFNKLKETKDFEKIYEYEERGKKLAYDTKYCFVVTFEVNPSFAGKITNDTEVRINDSKADQIEIQPEGLKTFVLHFETEPDQKSVTLNYSVGEEYEWTITNKMGTDVNAKDIWVGEHFEEETTTNTLVNVKVTELNLNPTSLLTITVDSENAVDDVYKMVTAEGREASYKITGTLADEAEEWLDGNKTVVLKTNKYIDGPANAVIASGVFSWKNDAPPILAGLYQDKLTFTAEIIEGPKKGRLIYLDNDGDGVATDPYRILKIKDNKAELLSLKSYKEEVPALDSKEEQKKYSETNIDTENENFYNELKNNNPSLANEILLTSIKDYEYKGDYSIPTDEHRSTADYSSKNEVETIERYCYSIDVEDIEEYFNHKFTSEDLISLFNESKPDITQGNKFWTRSRFFDKSARGYYVDARNQSGTGILFQWYDIKFDILPAFTIDLTNVDYVLPNE